jgi:putative ABC transport system permease protein
MTLPLKYSARNLWVRRNTTLATTAGVGLVVFVLAASLMLVKGIRKTLLSSGSRDAAIVMQQSATAEVASSLRQAVFGLVASAPGVKQSTAGALASSEVVRSLLIQSADGSRTASLQVRGVTDNVLALRPDVRIVAGRRATPATDEAMIGASVAGRYRGLALGGEIEVNKGRTLKVVGIFEAGGSAFESEIWADLHSVQTSTESDGYISSVTARLASADDFDAFASALQEGNKEEGLIVERESQYYERLSQGLSGMIMVLGGMVSVIFSLGALLGAAIAMYAAVEQRTPEIGVLRALGFDRREILLAFIVESVAISLIGTALGLSLALATALVEFAVGNSAAYGIEVRFRFIPSPAILACSALAGVLLGVLGGLFPALRASQIDPLRALRT